MDPADRIGALTFTKSDLGDPDNGELTRFKQSAFRKGGESRLLTGFARKRPGLGSAGHVLWCATFPRLLPQHDEVVVQPVTEKIESG